MSTEMNREAQIAGKVAKRVVSRDIDYYEPTQRFIKVKGALEDVIAEWEGYWRYGTAPDPILEDMAKVSGNLAVEARRMKKMLETKMAEWHRQEGAGK